MPDTAPPAHIDALRDPLTNRGTAFTNTERERLGLVGWLPPRVETLGEQAARVLDNVRRRPTNIDRYACLSALQSDNETLFYRVVIDNLQEMLPLVYTPTVGQACQEWSRLYARPRGLYLTPEHRGRIAAILRGWPQRDIAVIVATDGGRILGLGDLGANGMGIPIGKLALYTACAGVAPSRCLPVTLDVGTDTAAVRGDRFYIGRCVPRLAGAAYDEFIEEFVSAVEQVFPGVLLQFEDFANANAFALLARYRERLCCLNDDIQGTGAMGLAGLTVASRSTGRPLREQRILFVGAGEACLGIGMAARSALRRDGLSDEQALARLLFVDSQGMVVSSRTDLPVHKRAFAQSREPLPDLTSTIEAFKPTVLFGACGQGGRFTQPVLEAMARSCERPVVFALSNPTAKAECTAEQAYAWTAGRAIFASGSPFDPVTLAGEVHAAGQANNSFIFPGVGLGVLVSRASRVTDSMFSAAAAALASEVGGDDVAVGRIYPPQNRMRDVARAVATAVAKVAYDEGLATATRPAGIPGEVERAMYRPEYAT
ncbi:MAG: NAD-dependent malic enzyme [Burkholderiales bacterium]|nr:MAG: NAD-dependent malic enzyme [Burkholderiales bacterium]